MALTINKEPRNVCFAKNQQFVKATSTLYVETLATAGVFEWNIGAGTSGADGDVRRIRFWGKVVTFTFKTTPVLNGFELPLAGDVAIYLPYIIANQEIINDFTISTSSTKIFFTAKKLGNDTSVYVPGVDTIYFPYTPGVNLKYRDNFKILTEVYARIDSTTFEKIYAAELTPKRTTGTSGSIELNIEEILRSRLGYDFNPPENTHSWASQVIRDFYVLYFERYGAIANNYLSLKSNVFKALNAGVNARNYPSANNYLVAGLVTDYFFLDLDNRMNILTDDKMSHVLFFMAHNSIAVGATFSVQAIIYWDDNTSLYTDIYPNITRQTGEDVLMIPCGIRNSPLGAIVAGNLGRTIVKYTIRVNYNYVGRTPSSTSLLNPRFAGGPSGAVAIVSSVNADRTFIIDDRYHANAKYFRYVNSMGGLTVLRTTGEYEFGAEIGFEEFDKELANNYSSMTASERTIYNSYLTETFEAFSGFVTKYEVYKFLDFLLSEKKFEQIYQTGVPEHFGYANQFTEIKTDPGSYKLYKSKDGLFSFSFKYRYMHATKAINANDLNFVRTRSQ